MRLREFFYLLGFKPNYQFYRYEIQKINLEKDGCVEYARWLCPKYKDLILNQREIDDLRKFLGEGDFAIDIGAQAGDSTLPIALACGASGAVLAYEPNPMTFALLGANSALNPGCTNIIPIPFAVSEHDASLVFDYGDPWLRNGGDHKDVSKWKHGSSFSIPVQARNIESLIREKYGKRLARFNYLKTDVEGHDLATLRSVEGLIQEFRPHIKSEVGRYASDKDRKEMFEFFKDMNYELRKVHSDTLFGQKISVEGMASKRSFDVFAVPL
ncbi:MAG: FkbM family methyltransferase [Pirellulales bacterium]|jgi:FkbM family methyltransferase